MTKITGYEKTTETSLLMVPWLSKCGASHFPNPDRRRFSYFPRCKLGTCTTNLWATPNFWLAQNSWVETKTSNGNSNIYILILMIQMATRIGNEPLQLTNHTNARKRTDVSCNHWVPWPPEPLSNRVTANDDVRRSARPHPERIRPRHSWWQVAVTKSWLHGVNQWWICLVLHWLNDAWNAI